MVKRYVKFQKNRNKTVGGVANKVHTTIGGGRTDILKDRSTEERKAENYVSPLFFEKAGDNNPPPKQGSTLTVVWESKTPNLSYRTPYVSS